MLRLARTALGWLVCLQFVLLSACSVRGPASSTSGAPAVRMPAGFLWTNTFPPLSNPGATLRFQHYSLEEGLSQSTVLALLQDSQGFLWIGTQDGLDRFDGYSFTVFRPDPHDDTSISSGEILSLAQSSDGKIWVGTNAGLDRYDPVTRKFQHWLHDDENAGSLVDNTVTVVYEDPRGTLWVGTSKGLDRFIRSSGQFVHESLSGEPFLSGGADVIRSLYESDPRTLWIGTDNGLVRYSVPDGKVRRYLHDTASGTSITSNEVSSISQGADGQLWVGTHAGLDRLDPSAGQFSSFFHSDADSSSLADNWVQSTNVDRAGQLWIGTRNGLDRFDPTTGQFIHYQSDVADPSSLSSNIVDSIYEDRGGVLWVGTGDAGLDEHDRGQDQFAYYHHSNSDPGSLSSDVIFPIAPASFGRMWIGTYDAGLDLFDPATGHAEHFRHDPADSRSLASDTVLSLFVDHDQSLWVGTRQGLDRLLPGSSTFIHFVHDPADPTSLPAGAIYSIYQGRDSKYWIGTAHGLRILDPETGEISMLKVSGADLGDLATDPIMAIDEDGAGTLWFGTETRGLYRYDAAAGTLRHYLNDPSRSNSLSNNSVLDIYQDRSGTIWVATFGGGLDRYLPQQDAFRSYRREQGLPNDVIYGVLEDQAGDLWLSSNLGLSRFHVAKGSFENYTLSDGLQSNEFNSSSFAMDSRGRMYFGGIKGLTVFDPAGIRRDPYTPPLVVTSLSTQDGKPLPSAQSPETLQQITLGYPQNSLDLSFAALSFSRVQGNQYKYLLQGFDDSWRAAGPDHRASYTNLPGGTYILRVLGSNGDGVWNEAGASIQVTVIPPFWQTWVFRVLAGLGVVVVSMALYRSRVHSIEAQKLLLEQEVRDRTDALQKRNADLEALYSADEKMLRVFTQEDVLQALVDVAVDTLEADSSAVFAKMPGQDGFCIRVGKGFRSDTVTSSAFIGSQQAILADVALGRMVIVSDTPEDHQWRVPGEELQKLMSSEGFRTIMYMPIAVQEDVRGVLGVYCSTSPHTFNERRQRLFASLVQRAALSIENSRLFEESKQLAVLEERSRLAQDLHDSTKQKAFAALAQIGAVKKLVSRDGRTAAEHLEEAENIVTDVIRDLAFFIQEFYPTSLKDKGVAAALRSYTFAWERRSGIQLDLSIAGERRLPPHMEQALYRIVQEGLSNIARHSNATHASIDIVFGNDRIMTEIRDDGIGFDLPTTVRGLGLQLIQERAESIGGQARIETYPGSGTLWRIDIPVQG